MEVIGIIPARFESSRFPGKPLASIGDKSMIEWVYERVSSVLENVIVATDDKRIEEKVRSFGGQVLMTSPHHKSGTDRCAEALSLIEKKESQESGVIINIQGDEPFIRKEQIQALVSCFNDQETEIATLIRKIDTNVDVFNPNIVKVVVNNNHKAIYFSRSPIPHIRNLPRSGWAEHHTFYKHLGIYAFRAEVLKKVASLAPSSLELAESLEQNRWIEHGYYIKTQCTPFENIGIDSPDDIEKIYRQGLVDRP